MSVAPDALQRLHQICRAGRTYNVEQWIAEGLPLQVPASELQWRTRRSQTALEIALETGNHALVLLLPVNGYDPKQEDGSPLDQALSDRRWDLVDLLLVWGADPQDVDLETLFGTYQTSLSELFAYGVDLTANEGVYVCVPPLGDVLPKLELASHHRRS